MSTYVRVKNVSGRITFLESFDELPPRLRNKPNELVFKVDSLTEYKKALKEYTDKRKRNRSDIKTKISDIYPEWDISKISRPDLLLDRIVRKDWRRIYKQHNEEKWSDVIYCCDHHKRHINYNIDKYGLELGKIARKRVQ